MTTLTPTYLTELERLCGEATEDFPVHPFENHYKEYEFYNASRTAMPLLIARVRELEKNAAFNKCVKFSSLGNKFISDEDVLKSFKIMEKINALIKELEGISNYNSLPSSEKPEPERE